MVWYTDSSEMNLVFCMAGIYRRFREAGYTTPKFLLPWRGTTVLDHILASMLGQPPTAFSSVHFVANQRDMPWHDRLARVLGLWGIDAGCVRYVGDTAGQAATALIGIDLLRDRLGGASELQPVAFHNIDTILLNRDYREIAGVLGASDGYIDCIDADSPAYSFVGADAAGRAIEIAEKIVISRNATTGFYAFKSARTYRDWATQTSPAAGEFYISDVYKRMIAAGCDVRINTRLPDVQDTIILGTPAEYEALATPEDVRSARDPARAGGRV